MQPLRTLIGHVSFAGSSHRLVTFTVKNVGRLEEDDSELIDQRAASSDEGTDKACCEKGTR